MPLIEEWDGQSWSVVSTPNLDTNSLTSVSCLTSTDCWAVGGGSGYVDTDGALTAHWNGQSWSVVPARGSGRAEDVLLGIECVSESQCVATGATQDKDGQNPETLIESWNGSAWRTIQSGITNDSPGSTLEGVTCTSDQCWTVGEQDNLRTLIEQAAP